MSYITNNDIQERLGIALYVQLTDDAGTGSADIDKVDEARLGAEGFVNSYLTRRYAVPVDVAGEADLAAVLASITLDVAEFRLHARRPPVPGDVIGKQRAAEAWLEQVAAGRVKLPVTNELPQRDTDGPVADASGADRVLTRDEMDGL